MGVFYGTVYWCIQVHNIMMRIFFTLPCHKKQARQLSKRPAKESPEGTTGSYLQSLLPWLGCAQLVPVVWLLHISKSHA